MQSSWSWYKISGNIARRLNIFIRRKDFISNRITNTQVFKLHQFFNIFSGKTKTWIKHAFAGYVIYGYEEKDLLEAESNSSISIRLKRWKSTDSIYLVFSQHSKVRSYSCT